MKIPKLLVQNRFLLTFLPFFNNFFYLVTIFFYLPEFAASTLLNLKNISVSCLRMLFPASESLTIRNKIVLTSLFSDRMVIGLSSGLLFCCSWSIDSSRDQVDSWSRETIRRVSRVSWRPWSGRQRPNEKNFIVFK